MFNAERRGLDNLDAQAKAILLEQNTPHNLDAPTSNIPDEILAEIFEAGLHCDGPRFGELVSHVSRRWRSIALDDPNLWTSIRCHRIKGVVPMFVGGDEDVTFRWSECKGWKERTASYISRSKSLPVNIHIRGLYTEDYTPAFFQLISDHIGRCRQLFFEHIPRNIWPKLLDLLDGQPLPLLRSFALTLERGGTFHANPLPFRAPLLTTAQFGRIEPIPAFEYLTSLRLTDVAVLGHQAYNSLRNGLMNLKSLQHLELYLKQFGLLTSPDPLPILLPTIQLLHVASADYCHRFINYFIENIRAQSLTTLSLNGWDEEEDEPMEHHFPLLRHLLLVNVTKGLPDLLLLAEHFPAIERLTCQLSTNNNHSPNRFSINKLFTHIERLTSQLSTNYHSPNQFSISNLLAYVFNAGEEHQENRLPCPWPKLHTIATSASLVLGRTTTQHKKLEAVERLRTSISALQGNGHPIRKLLLPRSFFVKVGAEAEMGLRKVVEMEVYYDDWPMPFTGDRCADLSD